MPLSLPADVGRVHTSSLCPAIRSEGLLGIHGDLPMCWLEEGHPMLAFLELRNARTEGERLSLALCSHCARVSFRMHGLSKPVFDSVTSRLPVAWAAKVCQLARVGS